MPDVIIKTRSDWFPIDWPVNTDHGNRSNTYKQRLTLTVANKMPDITVAAFKSLPLGPLEPDEVVFDIVKLHAACSENQPDIAITISPAWSKDREAAKAGLVNHIRHELWSFLIVDAGLQPGSDDFPRIDIMVKFVIEAGVALDNRGETTSHWG